MLGRGSFPAESCHSWLMVEETEFVGTSWFLPLCGGRAYPFSGTRNQTVGFGLTAIGGKQKILALLAFQTGQCHGHMALVF